MHFFDLHCDTLYEMFTKDKEILKNDLNTDIERSLKYRPYIGCFAVWVPDNMRGKNAFDFFNKVSKKLYEQESLYGKYFKICKSFEDIKNLKERKGIILTVEGSAALGGKIKNISSLYKSGVRVMTLTWNGKCEVGDGADFEGGLSNFGYEVVKKMEETGIIVDVSHASEKLFYDVSQIASKPFIATHSNSRAVCSHRRNLTDEQFETIKSVKGLVGITFCNYFLSDKKQAYFDDLLRHVEHFLERGGENILAIGSDFDGAELPDGISGIESVEKIYENFLKYNYSERLLNKIFFENAYNFMRLNLT